MKNLSSTTTLVTIMSCGGHRQNVVHSHSSSNSLSPEKDSSFSTVLMVPRGGSNDKSDSNFNKETIPKNNDNRDRNKKSHHHSSKSKKYKKKRQRKVTKTNDNDDNDDDDDDDDDNTTSIPTNNNNNNNHTKERKVGVVEAEVLQCQDDDYYGILGIGKSASQIEVKKAYRRRCVHVHPDKTGGDRTAFDKVAESYDVLGDEDKRQLFDRHGKRGLDPNNPMGGSYQEFFRNAFANSRRPSTSNYTMRYQLQVTLEELYNGITQTVVVSPPNQRNHYQQHRNSKNVQVTIPKGSIEGQAIVLPGEMDFSNDTPGDLVFIVSQAPHPTFTRKGHDLAMEMTISLKEAVCGLVREIQHLDGSNLWIASATSTSNEDAQSDNNGNQEKNDIPIVIQTGDVQVLKGKGMPKKHQADKFGDLYIQFRVEMPKPIKSKGGGSPLTKEELSELSRLLSKLESSDKSSAKQEEDKEKELPEDNTTICSLQQAVVRDFGRASGPVHLEEDEYDPHNNPHNHPFGGSQFFSSHGNGSSGGFYFGGNFGGHPFGSAPYEGGGPDDENVQCTQM